MPLVVLGVVVLLLALAEATRFGTAIYAVGSDPEAAPAPGVRVPLVRVPRLRHRRRLLRRSPASSSAPRPAPATR